ncbi:MAG TPA: hypothetical protein VHF26_00550 [Trebonia sp.]|nr:hypothetical protein [Trebonia sp.]
MNVASTAKFSLLAPGDADAVAATLLGTQTHDFPLEAALAEALGAGTAPGLAVILTLTVPATELAADAAFAARWTTSTALLVAAGVPLPDPVPPLEPGAPLQPAITAASAAQPTAHHGRRPAPARTMTSRVRPGLARAHRRELSAPKRVGTPAVSIVSGAAIWAPASCGTLVSGLACPRRSGAGLAARIRRRQ